MAEEYVSYVLTNAGRNIMARIIAGTVVTFKRLAIGDGHEYDMNEFITKTALVNEVLSITDLSMQVFNSEVVEITGKFSTLDLVKSFWYREIGIYVIDPDDETKEILFAYGNRNDKAEFITPHVDNYQFLKEISCKVSVGESANVKIYINYNDVLNTFEFTVDDWKYNQVINAYVINTGQVGFGVNVFKKSELGRITVEFVDIIVDSNKVISLQALEPFEGYLIFA